MFCLGLTLNVLSNYSKDFTHRSISLSALHQTDLGYLLKSFLDLIGGPFKSEFLGMGIRCICIFRMSNRLVLLRLNFEKPWLIVQLFVVIERKQFIELALPKYCLLTTQSIWNIMEQLLKNNSALISCVLEQKKNVLPNQQYH